MDYHDLNMHTITQDDEFRYNIKLSMHAVYGNMHKTIVSNLVMTGFFIMRKHMKSQIIRVYGWHA